MRNKTRNFQVSGHNFTRCPGRSSRRQKTSFNRRHYRCTVVDAMKSPITTVFFLSFFQPRQCNFSLEKQLKPRASWLDDHYHDTNGRVFYTILFYTKTTALTSSDVLSFLRLYILYTAFHQWQLGAK